MFNINTLVADAKNQITVTSKKATVRYSTNAVSPMTIAMDAQVAKAKEVNSLKRKPA